MEDGFVFQQNNDPKYTARKTNTFFRTSRIKLLNWFEQSSDLNQNENLRFILHYKVEKGDVTNKIELLIYSSFEEMWKNNDRQGIKNLVENISRRFQAKGGHATYLISKLIINRIL